MKKTLIVLAMTAFLAAPAMADETTAATTVEASASIAAAPVAPIGTPVSRVREGQSIYSLTGERLGQVNRVTERGAVIVQGAGGRFTSVPLSSLTRVDGRIVTSVTAD